MIINEDRNFQNKNINAKVEKDVPAALTISNSSFCMYVFRTILRVNSDYLLKQPLTG
jgi:hypothetical protein